LYNLCEPSNSVDMEVKLWTGWPENVVRFPADATISIAELVLIKPPIQKVRGKFLPYAKRPGREADHSLSSSAEGNNEYAVTLLPYTFVACIGRSIPLGSRSSLRTASVTKYRSSDIDS